MHFAWENTKQGHVYGVVLALRLHQQFIFYQQAGFAHI